MTTFLLILFFLAALVALRFFLYGERERRVLLAHRLKRKRVAPPSEAPYWHLCYEVEREQYWEKIVEGVDPGDVPLMVDVRHRILFIAPVDMDAHPDHEQQRQKFSNIPIGKLVPIRARR